MVTSGSSTPQRRPRRRRWPGGLPSQVWVSVACFLSVSQSGLLAIRGFDRVRGGIGEFGGFRAAVPLCCPCRAVRVERAGGGTGGWPTRGSCRSGCIPDPLPPWRRVVRNRPCMFRQVPPTTQLVKGMSWTKLFREVLFTTHTHARARAHTHTHTHPHTHGRAHAQTHENTRARAREHKITHTHIYACTRTRTYIHTHTHA